VPPQFVAELMRMLAQGVVRPRALWAIAARIVADPPIMAACSPFVDWCRIAVAMGAGTANPLAVAMGAGTANPLRGIDGGPAPVAHDDALGLARLVVCNLDFPPAMAPAHPVAPLLPAPRSSQSWMP
jgi:hypothetical protein